MIVCPSCKQEKPESAFARNPQARNGKHLWCKPCAAREESWRRRGGWEGFWQRMSQKLDKK